jgi:hypothetical protein
LFFLVVTDLNVFRKSVLVICAVVIVAGLVLPMIGYAVPSLDDVVGGEQLSFFTDPTQVPAGYPVMIFALDSKNVNSVPWFGIIPSNGAGGQLTLSFSEQAVFIPTQDATLHVTVIGLNGSPLSNAFIQIASNPDLQSIGYTRANSQGQAEFSIVAASQTPYPTSSNTPFPDPFQTATPSPTASPSATLPATINKTHTSWLSLLNMLTLLGIIGCIIAIVMPSRGNRANKRLKVKK